MAKAPIEKILTPQQGFLVKCDALGSDGTGPRWTQGQVVTRDDLQSVGADIDRLVAAGAIQAAASTEFIAQLTPTPPPPDNDSDPAAPKE